MIKIEPSEDGVDISSVKKNPRGKVRVKKYLL